MLINNHEFISSNLQLNLLILYFFSPSQPNLQPFILIYFSINQYLDYIPILLILIIEVEYLILNRKI